MGSLCNHAEHEVEQAISSKMKDWKKEKQDSPMILVLSLDPDDQIEFTTTLQTIYNKRSKGMPAKSIGDNNINYSNNTNKINVVVSLNNFGNHLTNIRSSLLNLKVEERSYTCDHYHDNKIDANNCSYDVIPDAIIDIILDYYESLFYQTRYNGDTESIYIPNDWPSLLYEYVIFKTSLTYHEKKYSIRYDFNPPWHRKIWYLLNQTNSVIFIVNLMDFFCDEQYQFQLKTIVKQHKMIDILQFFDQFLNQTQSMWSGVKKYQQCKQINVAFTNIIQFEKKIEQMSSYDIVQYQTRLENVFTQRWKYRDRSFLDDKSQFSAPNIQGNLYINSNNNIHSNNINNNYTRNKIANAQFDDNFSSKCSQTLESILSMFSLIFIRSCDRSVNLRYCFIDQTSIQNINAMITDIQCSIVQKHVTQYLAPDSFGKAMYRFNE